MQADDLAQALADPNVLAEVYGENKDTFRQIIEADAEADDVYAITKRRKVVAYFRQLMEDDKFFDDQVEKYGGPEKVWQHLFNNNSWLLGVGLSGQLFTSWDKDRLQGAVTGPSVAGPGKITDALMRTSGVVKSMVFAEIKHHRTRLVRGKDGYRSGCWAVSNEVAGGVAQAQGTVQMAVQQMRQMGDAFPMRLPGGKVDYSDVTYLFSPRSFFVVGSLSEFIDDDCGHYRLFRIQGVVGVWRRPGDRANDKRSLAFGPGPRPGRPTRP
ncbi:MAG: DUF4263 domain-containing protein, partial [Propionibacteriaceae bacterium]|nr:DUF4263 domain-containing protein [Propionibacteriaceae bacterium]